MRRQRPWEELARDPRLPYMVGRLVGANLMASALLSQEQESANAQKIAAVLWDLGNFFMEEEPKP